MSECIETKPAMDYQNLVNELIEENSRLCRELLQLTGGLNESNGATTGSPATQSSPKITCDKWTQISAEDLMEVSMSAKSPTDSSAAFDYKIYKICRQCGYTNYADPTGSLSTCCAGCEHLI